MKELIEALNILAKYTDQGIAAEDDIIYSCVNGDMTTPEDTARLKELDWYVESKSKIWAFFV